MSLRAGSEGEVRTFCGRMFLRSELELMRQVATEYPALAVTEIARTVCELLDWKRPGGNLKNHECRQLLEQLAQEEYLQLPTLQDGMPGPEAGQAIAIVRGTRSGGVQSPGMRAAGIDAGGGPTGKPSVARAHGALSLYGLQRAIWRQPALLGAPLWPGLGLYVMDIASVEDAGAGSMDRLG